MATCGFSSGGYTCRLQEGHPGNHSEVTLDDLKQALRQIMEISYAGASDGRETRLELITRIAKRALEMEGRQ
jgi:hypothetical protein